MARREPFTSPEVHVIYHSEAERVGRVRSGSCIFTFVESGELTLRLIRCLAPLALGLMIVAAASPARAIDAVSVRGDAPAIDLTGVLEHQHSDSDRIQVSTAPGTDGIVRRIQVRAREGSQDCVVFALANNTDDQLDRLIVAPDSRAVGSA